MKKLKKILKKAKEIKKETKKEWFAQTQLLKVKEDEIDMFGKDYNAKFFEILKIKTNIKILGDRLNTLSALGLSKYKVEIIEKQNHDCLQK